MCGTKKILVVEDNADLCDLLSIIIRRLGYEVAVAITGEDAVARAAAMKPNLILMDVGLPKFNGVEATTQIKADPTTKNIPVVILNALPMGSHGKDGIKAGAAEVMQKPVRVTDIEQILSKYTAAGSKPPMKSSRNSVGASTFRCNSSSLVTSSLRLVTTRRSLTNARTTKTLIRTA